jgi:hypothetical protein
VRNGEGGNGETGRKERCLPKLFVGLSSWVSFEALQSQDLVVEAETLRLKCLEDTAG